MRRSLNFSRARLFSAVALTVSTGCGKDDPKAPTKENFSRVIMAAMQTHPRALRYHVYSTGAGAGISPPRDEKTIKALMDAGLLIEKEEPGPLGTKFRSKEPTAEGQSVLHVEQTKFERTVSLTLANADPASVEVLRFSEPVEFMGKTVTEVEFKHRWTPGTVLTSSKFEMVRDAIKDSQEFKCVKDPGSAKVLLVLYSDGWRAEE